MTRSATAFAFGDRNGVSRVSIPKPRAFVAKARPYTASRSRSTHRGRWPQAVASVSWRQTHAAVGCAVTPMCTSSRRPCVTNRSTHDVRNASVCTVQRSAAQRVRAWSRRKARQVWLGRPGGCPR
jgi:hypothetical protein